MSKVKGTIKERRQAARERKLAKTSRYFEARAKEHPEEVKARGAVAAALKRGDLERSEICSACGELKLTVAHHWSYARKCWLAVVWMCQRCHQKHTM